MCTWVRESIFAQKCPFRRKICSTESTVNLDDPPPDRLSQAWIRPETLNQTWDRPEAGDRAVTLHVSWQVSHESGSILICVWIVQIQTTLRETPDKQCEVWDKWSRSTLCLIVVICNYLIIFVLFYFCFIFISFCLVQRDTGPKV